MQQDRKYPVVKIVFTLSLLTALGCGGKPASVSGTVSVDGKPLNQGNVIFSPASGGMRSSGLIGSDGKYSISTNRESGLEVGDYEVAVVSRELVFPNGPDSPPMPGKYLAPKKYGKPKTSGLRFPVVKGSNEIDLALSSDSQ